MQQRRKEDEQIMKSVLKTYPKLTPPFKCYIYETKARTDTPTFVDEDGVMHFTHDEDDFCSFGERKDENEQTHGC